METFWQDLKYGARQLARNPGFTAVAVLTLALGIGANTAMFSVVNTVLLRPLPYTEPQQLVMLWHNNTKEHEPKDWLSLPTFDDLRRESKTLADLAGISPRWRFALNTDRGLEEIEGYWVSHSFFHLLGVRPLLGRGFTSDEDKPGGAPAVLLSYEFWQTQFAGDPQIVGKTIPLDTQTVPVVGILPPGFRFFQDLESARGMNAAPAVWMPLEQNPIAPRGRPVRWVRAVGRLAPGATLHEARSELAALTAKLAAAYPDTNAGLGATVLPLREQLVGGVRAALLVLLGAVGFILLIACVNVASLLVARAAAREKEIAVRSALGAGPWRLVRQFLTESLVLGLAGGAAGLMLAYWAVAVLRGLAVADVPRMDEVSIDGTVLAFTLGASLVTGILFGLLPALRVSRSTPQESLKEGGHATAAAGSRRARGMLVVAEIALTLVTVTGAGLLLRSFAELRAVNPGFEADHVLTIQLGVPDSYPPARRIALYREMFTHLEALPGVVAAGGTTRLPLGPGVTTGLEIEGRPLEPGQQPEIEFRRAGGDYFRAMGVPLRAGRLFSSRDTAQTTPVALVNEATARRFWPGENPVGQRVRFGKSGSNPWTTIVGVVGSVKHFGLDQPAPPEVYIDFDQAPPSGPLLAVRTSLDPVTLIPVVRQELLRLEQQLLISHVETMDQRISESVAGRRFQTWLLGGFGAVALLLAAVGIYGVMAFMVAQRTHEIGIRMALGARPRNVLQLVVGQGMLLAAAGVGVGLLGALTLTRYLKSLLFGVTPTDPLTLAGAASLLLAVALLASYLPARRAARVDPMVALRYE